MIAPAREPPEIQILVTKEVASAALAVDGRTLQKFTHPNGTLPCIRIGGGKRPLLRYKLSDLEAWVDKQRAGDSPKTIGPDESRRTVRLLEASSGLQTTTTTPET